MLSHTMQSSAHTRRASDGSLQRSRLCCSMMLSNTLQCTLLHFSTSYKPSRAIDLHVASFRTLHKSAHPGLHNCSFTLLAMAPPNALRSTIDCHHLYLGDWSVHYLDLLFPTSLSATHPRSGTHVFIMRFLLSCTHSLIH